MEPTHYLRILRLRWKILVLAALVGGLIGYASTLYPEEETGPLVTYYAAKHTLVVDLDVATRFPNLPQVALRVTGGAVPQLVAEELGGDGTELAMRVRTVTMLDVNAIEISAVATDPEEAAALADAFALGLLDYLTNQDVVAYEEALTAAEAKVASTRLEFDTVLLEIDAAEDQLEDLGYDPRTGRALDVADDIADGSIDGSGTGADTTGTEGEDATVEGTVGEADDTEDSEAQQLYERLQALRITRDLRQTAYDTALLGQNELVDDGEPAPVLESLDQIAPYEISGGEYSTRIRQGRTGANNFTGNDNTDSGGGSGGIGARFENPLLRVAFGALAGLLIAIGAIMLHLRLDPRLRNKQEMELAFGAPVLAEIPRFPKEQRESAELHAVEHPRSVVTEAYRVVRSALLFARASTEHELVTAPVAPSASMGPGDPGNGNGNGSAHGRSGNGSAFGAGSAADREVRVVMVTSPGASEGKTTTTANLAVVLAEAGYQVLVVNCDYRLPRLHEYFGAPHDPRKTIKTGIPGVTLVADVTDPMVTNPTMVVESQRALIAKARETFDVVLLDTAPLLATNDALSLLPTVDLVVLVAREGRTSREAAVETRELLSRRRAKVAGLVLTDAVGSGGSRYYYRYRYASYYTSEGEAVDRQGSRSGGGSGKRSKQSKRSKRSRRSAASGTADRPSGSKRSEQSPPKQSRRAKRSRRSKTPT